MPAGGRPAVRIAGIDLDIPAAQHANGWVYQVGAGRRQHDQRATLEDMPRIAGETNFRHLTGMQKLAVGLFHVTANFQGIQHRHVAQFGSARIRSSCNCSSLGAINTPLNGREPQGRPVAGRRSRSAFTIGSFIGAIRLIFILIGKLVAGFACQGGIQLRLVLSGLAGQVGIVQPQDDLLFSTYWRSLARIWITCPLARVVIIPEICRPFPSRGLAGIITPLNSTCRGNRMKPKQMTRRRHRALKEWPGFACDAVLDREADTC